MPKSWISSLRSGASATLGLLAAIQAACAAPAPLCDSAFIEEAGADSLSALSEAQRGESLDALFSCLASPDPALRDALAYQRLTELMRSEELTPGELRSLFDRSLATLLSPDETDPDGVFRPFAALVLAEAVRADRISPYLISEERTAALEGIGIYLRSLSDYRGFDPQTGWRHGVAHSADVLLQMVLNPAFDAEDHATILALVASKVAPQDHAYVFGEPRRLARPVLYIALSGTIGTEDWQAWFSDLVDPAPLPSWEEVWTSAEGLSRLHNLRAFLTAIYVSSDSSGATELNLLRDRSLAALSELP